MRKPILLFVAALVLPAQEIRLARVASSLTGVTDIQSARDGSGRLFLAQQFGVIRILSDSAALAAVPLLDIQNKTRMSGECGLLGLAFPPSFARKRYFYVNYTNPQCRESYVARYRMATNETADPASEEILMTVQQPFTNHNGGQIQFGPDGYLYIGWGDGGSGGDPQNHGQRRDSLLGKILRIDTESGASTYNVPSSNPFAGDSRYRPEIWALGVRNPWRFSFDRETGDLWMGDVGQNRAEEINFQSHLSKGGENYGWRLMEGVLCYNPANNCDQTGLTHPVLEYGRSQGDVSVTGGYVYRGSRWASLRGTYIYGDYASGRIWGIRREGPLFNNRLLLAAEFNIATFGEDEAGEIYVADHGRGLVYRIDGADSPRFISRSVVNAASYDIGLTPGSAAALFAAAITSGPGVTAAPRLPLPRELAGVRVTVNGSDVPLYSVANRNGMEQVNFQAPFDLPGSTARVAVIRDGRSSPEVEVPVAAVQPGVFAIDDSDAIVVDALSNALLTRQRPLRRGDLVYIYATGLGPVDNAPATGSPSPRDPLARVRTSPSVTIGGIPCEVLFAGLAPDFAGVYQVNLRIPQGIAAGTREIVVRSGEAQSRVTRVVVE